MVAWIDVLYITAAIAGILSLFYSIYASERGKRRAGLGLALFFILTVAVLVINRGRLADLLHANTSNQPLVPGRLVGSSAGKSSDADQPKPLSQSEPLPSTPARPVFSSAGKGFEANQAKLSSSPRIALPLAESFHPAEMIKREALNGTIDRTLGPYKCMKETDKIVCYLVVTRVGEGSGEYRALANYVKLIDDLNIVHDVLRVYFIDRKGTPQEMIILGSGDAVWVAYEFGGAPNDIGSARIVYSDNSQLHLRVE